MFYCAVFPSHVDFERPTMTFWHRVSVPSHLSRTALTNKSSVWTGGTEKRTTYFYATSSRDDEVKTSLTNRVLIDDPGNQKKVDVKKKTSLCLPTVFLPDELQKSIDIVLAKHSGRKEATLDGQDLAKYLMNHVPPDCDHIWPYKSTNGKSFRFNSKYNPTSVQTRKSGKPRQDGTTKPAPNLKYRRRESLAFLAGRTQASYGVALRVLSEVAKNNESYGPHTLLDFGSGVGTVEWAAHHLWKDSLYEYQCIDISPEMLELAKRLRSGGDNLDNELETEKKLAKESIPNVYSRQYLPLSRQVKYDVVVSGHTLGELPSIRLRSFTIAALWRKTKDYLILIEPGTWSGYRIIMEARDLILNASEWTKYEDETAESLLGHVFAPCPHDSRCPLLPDQDNNMPQNPCHFAQRVQLSLSEKSTFLKKNGYHIENFSYIVFKKGPRETTGEQRGRLIEPVKKRSRHIICKLCTTKGTLEQTIFTKKKHGELYKEGRKAKWGDVLTLNGS